MNNSNIMLSDPIKALERLIELHILVHDIQERGIETDYDFESMKKYNIERLTLKNQLAESLKLANELRSTHNFYIKSGNGQCAGVTSQILNLSSYGGKLIE